MPKPRVALLATCLVDAFRPSVGFAAIKLLEDAGCVVEVPPNQTCCGQPAWNSGDRASAVDLARRVIADFAGYDYVVVPSGSCAATLVKDYPDMFSEGDPWRERALELAGRTHEITEFLADTLDLEAPASAAAVVATYHDGCSGLRSLGVKDQPRKLLAGSEIREMKEAEVCCGFGGTFCVKYPEISNVMVSDKSRNAADTGADLLLAGDLGCLLNIAGKAQREGRTLKARHVVEVLAGMTGNAAIGEAEG